MKKTYAQLVKHIESLRGQAEEARRREMQGVIDSVKKAVEFYGLTAADLGLDTPASASRGTRSAAAKVSGNIKYRDDAGNVWSGRGPRPRWLREALESGKQLEDLLA